MIDYFSFCFPISRSVRQLGRGNWDTTGQKIADSVRPQNTPGMNVEKAHRELSEKILQMQENIFATVLIDRSGHFMKTIEFWNYSWTAQNTPWLFHGVNICPP